MSSNKLSKNLKKESEPMTQPNLVSLNISEADLAEFKASINTLSTKLLPHLITLSPEERQELPKMGDKTVSFVSANLADRGVR
jgi:hypothetical protein